MDIQTTTAPFNKPDVMQAINYAIDRQSLVQVQAVGLRRARLPALPPGLRWLRPQAGQPLPLQPGQGQAAAGRGRLPARHQHHHHQRQPDDPLAEQLQSQLKPAGITATISDVPDDTETQYLYLDKTIPFAIDGTAGRTSPVEMLDVLYSQQGLMNVDGKAATAPPGVPTRWPRRSRYR